MIPLFAMEQYNIQNGVFNQPATYKLEQRKNEFREYLMQRNYGVHYVSRDQDPNSAFDRGLF